MIVLKSTQFQGCVKKSHLQSYLIHAAVFLSFDVYVSAIQTAQTMILLTIISKLTQRDDD